MPNIMNDIVLPQDQFVHVKNKGPDFSFFFASKRYTIKSGDTELMNYHLYSHARKSFDGATECPLEVLDENTGSIEYARARAKQAELNAEAAVNLAKETASKAEAAKKDLAQARIAAREFEGKPPAKDDK